MVDNKMDKNENSPTEAPVTILSDYHDVQFANVVIEAQDDSEAIAPTKTLRMKPKDESSFSI